MRAVIAKGRHCERSEAISVSLRGAVIARSVATKQTDEAIWIASSLAMTVLAQRHCERIVIASEAKQSSDEAI